MGRLVAAMLSVAFVAGACGDDVAGVDDATGAAPGAETSGCGGAGDAAPGVERLTLVSDGTAREYERVVPPSYDAATPHPVIVALHGFTSTIEQISLFSGLPDVAAERGYILLTPQALPARLPIGGEEIVAPFWNVVPGRSADLPGVVDDVAFLNDLIDSTAEELCVDRDRIHATGNSNGAGMATELACAAPGLLAAIAPVSGANLAESCRDPEAVSVIAFHGDADPLVEYEGGSAASVPLESPSVPDRVAEFAGAAECAAEPVESLTAEDVATTRWVGCVDGVDVELHTVLGGGHTWPGMLNYLDLERLTEIGESQQLLEVSGGDPVAIAGHMTVAIEATDLMVDFFDSHPRPR